MSLASDISLKILLSLKGPGFFRKKKRRPGCARVVSGDEVHSSPPISYFLDAPKSQTRDRRRAETKAGGRR